MTSSDARCFHCGEPLPRGEPRMVDIDGARQPVCCAGCEAVASLIAGCGLDDFYRFRTAPAPKAERIPPSDQWLAWDREAVQAEHVTELPSGSRRITLSVEGITCAACSWLIEHALSPMPGVQAVDVNPATARATLEWNPDKTALSLLLRRIAELGYTPHPVGTDQAESAIVRERRSALKRLAVAGLGMMQVMMYAVGLYAGAIHEDIDAIYWELLRWVSLLVATPVVVYAGAPFFRGAWRGIRALRPGMDVPVALAVGGAYVASTWHTFAGSGEVYFDSVTMFIFFLTVARFLEMSARHRAARGSEVLSGLLPTTATRITPEGTERVGTRELRPGDRVRIAVGESVPADGWLLIGQSHLNEAMLTGESRPVSRHPGDRLVAGSINETAPIDMEVDEVGGATVLAGMMRLIDNAQGQRPAIAQLAERVASRFVVGVLLAAAATGAVWLHIDPARAFEVVLAVLVVTCPCALSLATPGALVAASAQLARRGVLVARGSALEALARVDHVVFDKTGTLTLGQLQLQDVVDYRGFGRERSLALAAALERHSNHPLARAFADVATDLAAETVTERAGAGVEGVVDGRRVRIGRPDWVAGLSEQPLPDVRGGETAVALGDEDGIIAVITLRDQLRLDAEATIRALIRQGLRLELASGDAPGSVASVADSLGIEAWHAVMSPDQKLERIAALQAAGRRVAVVGDGINDGPVLARADVSIAMGAGSAVARANGDLIVVSEGLGTIAQAREVARRTLRIIRQNIAWAVGYNVAALPLAAAGIIPPWMAAVGMSLSSLLVVGNAMRLSRAPQPAAAERETLPPAVSEEVRA